MKDLITVFISISFFLGCITSKDVENLSVDKRILYPIGDNNKWGFANSEGETVIEPIYESVEFFRYGLALVKSNGKYGFLKKDGSWHIKAKYDSATSFFSNCTSVSTKNDTFYINRQGRRMKLQDCIPGQGGGCKILHPANPNDHFKVINGKYELEYKYYLKIDSSNYIEVTDTSDLRIDEVIAYGYTHILLKRDGKYGLFDIWSPSRVIDKNNNPNHEESAHYQLSNLIEFKYDEVTFERFQENEVTYAKVRVGNKYGVINSIGQLELDIVFDSVEIEPGWQMALVEYEPNRFGYKKFNGKEFFKRKGNLE